MQRALNTQFHRALDRRGRRPGGCSRFVAIAPSAGRRTPASALLALGRCSLRRREVCVAAASAGGGALPAQAGPFAGLKAALAQKVQGDNNFIFKLCTEVGTVAALTPFLPLSPGGSWRDSGRRRRALQVAVDEVITVVVNVLARGSPLLWDAATWAQACLGWGPGAPPPASIPARALHHRR